MIATTEQGIRSAEQIAQWAREFEGQPVERILAWAVEAFAPRLVMTSNFGVEGIVVLDHLRRVAPETPVVYLETGYQFAETDRLKEEVRERFGVNIVEVRPRLSVEEQDRVYGERLYAHDSDSCCRMRKVEPLAAALAGYDAWIAALRRDASPTRSGIGVVEWNARRGMTKINPLAGWTRERVWDYIFRHRLPYNALYDDGFTSIGCAPCTRRVAPGQHERAGRWDGETKLECGIHL